MRINGFPENGFIEFKACMMGEKMVEIITCKGTAFAKFVCGLEQGNPDSPTIANLVIKMKHDVWRTMTEELQEILKRDKNGYCDRYRFYVCDADDGEVWVYMMGYCDDNTKFLQTADENDLLPLVQRYVQLAGDLSMVTKIGRKSSKCEIQFYNISAQLTLRLRKCWSTAWSFIHDAPIEEQVPFKVHLQPVELEKFYKLSKYNELNPDEKEKWDKIVTPKAHKHLGLSATLGANTSSSGNSTIQKIYERLSKLKIRHMELEAQRKCSNMLLATMHSYAPLQVDFNQEELFRLDLSIANTISRKNGISQTDSKHRIFLPSSMGGLGFKSTLEVDITANGRELEIVCNGNGLDSETFRSRIAAIPGYVDIESETIQNHARAAIHKLARYGFFLRDKRDGVVNNIMEKLAKENGVHTIGHNEYMDGNAFSIGFGKEKYLRYALGSPLHLMLRELRNNNWTPNGSESTFKTKVNVSITDILRMRKELSTKDFREKANFYSYLEWTNLGETGIEKQVPISLSDWTLVNVGDKILNSNKRKAWEWDDQKELQIEMKEATRIRWDNHIISGLNVTNCIHFGTYGIYGRIFNFLDTRGSPLIVATDGAHEQDPHHNTAAAFVICCLDIRKQESMDSKEWVHRPMIPLLARTADLPQHIGYHKSDIAHGEAGAFIMTEMALDKDFPRITITDSAAVRNQMINVRENTNGARDRNYIRNISGGISKFLMSTISSNLHDSTSLAVEPNPKCARSIMISKFGKRTQKFLKIAQQWTIPIDPVNEVTIPQNTHVWKVEAFDAHVSRPILKVNSHQLDQHGQRIKKSPRYATLIPNISMLNANHHADRCADLGLTLQSQGEHNPSRKNHGKLQMPPSNLNFFITIDGTTVDRHISDAIQHRFHLEKLKRLRTKSTQGLLWRLHQHVTIDWKTLNLHKGLFRSLLGMSNTHTRQLYKSVPYRTGCIHKYIDNIKDNEKKQCILTSSTKDQISHVIECSWCNTGNVLNSKGNRKHAMLFCSNERLQKFRQRVNNLIGLKLEHMFHEIQKLSSTDTVIKMVKEIEESFTSLQNSQDGRIVKLSVDRNIGYIGINTILEKLQVDDIQTAIKDKPYPFFLKLFHITPEPIMREPTDSELGTIDSPWLGLMPSLIDRLIKRHIHNLSTQIPDKDEAKYWKLRLSHSWKAIISVNMGRCIGLHRIINEVGSDKEKELVDKFNLEDLVKRTHLKRRMNAKRQRDMIEIQTKTPDRKKARIEDRITSQCNGITCGADRERWCGPNTFRPNSILVQRKQCMRCSVFTTAMKASADILLDMHNTTNKIQHKFISLLRKLSKQYRIDFTSLMNMLKLHISANKQFTGAQYIRKNRPSEKWKRICKILIEFVKRPKSNAIGERQPSALIKDWIDELQLTISTKNNELMHDKKFLQQCLIATPKIIRDKVQTSTTIPTPLTTCSQPVTKAKLTATIHHPPKPTIDNQGKHLVKDAASSRLNREEQAIKDFTQVGTSDIEIIDLQQDSQENDKILVNNTSEPSEEEQELLLFARINIMNRRSFLGGSIILMAIEIIRKQFCSQGVFVACTEAVERIANWNTTQGWESFARIFYNRNVITRRPNGLYLIPILENSHWYLIAIFKRRRFRVAAVIDSLGRGSIDSQVTNLISQAFKPNRGNMRWMNPECRKQTNVECGSRVICAMKCLAAAHASGSNFEESVKHASLMDRVPETEYDEMRIRTTAAHWTAQYRHSMRTRAIR